MKRRTVVWGDAQGQTTATLLTTSSGATALQAAMASHSNAVPDLVWEGDLTVTASPSPTAAPFVSVRDRALLLFQTASGEVVTLNIPAPKASIFLADDFTVDPTKIGDVIAAAAASVVTVTGDAVKSYVGGARQRK